jgi:hypothetical protein
MGRGEAPHQGLSPFILTLSQGEGAKEDSFTELFIC